MVVYPACIKNLIGFLYKIVELRAFRYKFLIFFRHVLLIHINYKITELHYLSKKTYMSIFSVLEVINKSFYCLSIIPLVCFHQVKILQYKVCQNELTYFTNYLTLISNILNTSIIILN